LEDAVEEIAVITSSTIIRGFEISNISFNPNCFCGRLKGFNFFDLSDHRPFKTIKYSHMVELGRT